MRIVIDMQGAQSTGSRHRGIGRYTISLCKEMVRLRGEYDVILALNGLFPDTIQSIRAAFAELLQEDNIRVWEAVGPVNAADPLNDSRRHVAEMAREAFLSSLCPDIVLNTSLFEGFVDDAITSIGSFTNKLPSAVILYDLIPLIHRDIYLQNPQLESFYLNKLDHLRRSDLLLSISASSGQEAVDYLGFPPTKVVNISTACDSHFRPMAFDETRHTYLKKTYGLVRPFVMYTGGIDHRKNIGGLIRAYANLPKGVRAAHQLAVVCSIQAPDREQLRQLANKEGLAVDELVITGFVPEEDLLALYNVCKLFVFPSWHEGFGLPALEAMACGRAVIGANTSSVPEVIEREDALFDPLDNEAITRKIAEVLRNDDFRAELERHGLAQAKKFSWEQTARCAWEALGASISTKKQTASISVLNVMPRRPRLAYISPLPPEQSGISYYSAELLPELARHYQIEVIVAQKDVSDAWVRANCPIRDVAWFRLNAHRFDRLLYHFGNSPFHSHMFDLLAEVPGVVVMHDFFLSDIVVHMDVHRVKSHGLARALVHAHGWSALQERYQAKDVMDIAWAYPCNLEVLQQAFGVIVHSEYSRRLAEKWYCADSTDAWAVIPHLRVPAIQTVRHVARKTLGLVEEDFVVCSFGLLGQHKLNHRLLATWLASPLANDPRCRLVFVGQNHGGEYGAELIRTIRDSAAASRIEITGWANAERYRTWLAAADVGVQLRTRSRGETSGTVLDCMNHSIATIVNAHGSMADLPRDSVWMLPDEFSDEQLIEALTTLWRNTDRLHTMGERAREVIHTYHQPRRCAEQYAQAIERFYQKASVSLPVLVGAIARVEPSLPAEDMLRIATILTKNLPPLPRRKQLLLDISELVQRKPKSDIQRVVRALLLEFLRNQPEGWAVEPVFATNDFQGYRYARCFTSRFLEVDDSWAEDEMVECWLGDIFVGLDLQHLVVPLQKDYLLGWQRLGIKTVFIDRVALDKCQHDIVAVATWLRQMLKQPSQLEYVNGYDANDPYFQRVIADGDASGLGNWIRFTGQISECGTIRLRYQIEGPFETSYSLALVNREVAFALNRKDPGRVGVFATEGPGDYQPDRNAINAIPGLGNLWQRGKKGSRADVVIRNLYPPRVADMDGLVNFLYFAWEESGLNPAWVASFNLHLDGMTVLSEYIKKVLLDNGVFVPSIAAGCGIDHLARVERLPYPDQIGEGFRFLHISSCFPRKGMDVLLKAYVEAFNSADDVTLVIKTFPNPHNTLLDQIRQLRAKESECPRIVVIEDDLPPGQIVDLYQRCHAFVAPSRGEGFGLPMAEAMWFGLPVITTAYGGQSDFCTEETAWLVDYRFAPAETHMGLYNSVWVEPDKADLVRQMRAVRWASKDVLEPKLTAARALLGQKYTWDRCADRVRELEQRVISRPLLSSQRIRLGWISSWNSKCGIAAYSSFLINELDSSGFDVRIFASKNDVVIATDDRNVCRCWTDHSGDVDELLVELANADLNAIIVQHNFGFISMRGIGKLIEFAHSRNLPIIFTFHATKDVNTSGLKASLGSIVNELSGAARLLVHGLDDLNRMKEWGLVQNAAIFPHGVLSRPMADMRGARESACIPLGAKVIASYGFMLPHKGLEQLIEALALIRQNQTNVYLLMVNALYPNPVSDQVLMRCRKLIEDLSLNEVVSMVTDFLPDERSLALLDAADVIAYPYQETAESSSAAVRHGLASHRPVACTPLTIFDDVSKVVHLLPGLKPQQIAQGLLYLLSTPQLLEAKSESQEEWLHAHAWPIIGHRLAGMIEGLVKAHGRQNK
jgi:glycosyltransferase involved in cell wall biosynthesis